MHTVLRYAGGKSRAARVITEEVVPRARGRVVSPFLGGGSLEVLWATEHGVEVHAADVFPVLTNFWDVLLKYPTALADQLAEFDTSPSTYKAAREELLAWDVVQHELTTWRTAHYQRIPHHIEPVRAAALYYFTHNLSYGPMFLGWQSKIYRDPARFARMVERVRAFQAPSLRVTRASFTDTICAHPNDFLYLDPPYYLDKCVGNRMFVGLYPNRNFPVHHDTFDHAALRDLLHAHKGGWVLSYNDCAWVREAYAGYTFKTPRWAYSLGQGETRREAGAHVKESHEVLIIKEHT